MPYLVTNKPLPTNQRGNKKWHSTETSLIHTTDAILGEIDQTKTSAVVLLDISKAIDSIYHSILLDKLQDIGASTSTLTWFTSYLSERNQVVRINSTARMLCHWQVVSCKEVFWGRCFLSSMRMICRWHPPWQQSISVMLDSLPFSGLVASAGELLHTP